MYRGPPGARLLHDQPNGGVMNPTLTATAGLEIAVRGGGTA
jgi:hypothetical protein